MPLSLVAMTEPPAAPCHRSTGHQRDVRLDDQQGLLGTPWYLCTRAARWGRRPGQLFEQRQELRQGL